MSEHVFNMNAQYATFEDDMSDPMLFDVPGMKKRYEEGHHLPAGVTPEEVKKWRTIYTTYFDSTLSIQDGRRVGLDKCCENPNVHMLSMALDLIKIRYVIEPLKRHPRDYWANGRIKVEVVDSAGRPTNTAIGTSKRKLFNAIADKMPEAIVRYTDMLDDQKAVVAAKKEEMRKLKEAQQPKAAPEIESKKKNKKKK